MFQVVDEMNVSDRANNTGFVQVFNKVVSTYKVKQGGVVTMGVAEKVVKELMATDSNLMPLLLIINRNEYEKLSVGTDGPIIQKDIHQWFELSRSQYLTVPRSIMQAMPAEWQVKMVESLEELDEKFKWRPVSGDYLVRLKNDKGHYLTDPLAEYNHPDQEYIETLKLP